MLSQHTRCCQLCNSRKEPAVRFQVHSEESKLEAEDNQLPPSLLHISLRHSMHFEWRYHGLHLDPRRAENVLECTYPYALIGGLHK